MDKKILIASIVIIAVACAGAVAAVTWNDTDMKTASFDGIKMKVPSDAKFTQTVDGFKNSEYGITVKTFDSNESMVNYLKNISTGKMTPVANQPPNSVAFIQDNITHILVTNGEEGICVGAIDQDLVVKMANSVVFSNGKHAELDKGFFGIGAKHLNPKVDFNLILAIIGQVNNNIFNENIFINNILPALDENNTHVDTNDANTTTDDGDILSENECKNIAEKELQSGDTVSSVTKSGDTYIFDIENSAGDSCGSITVDAKTGDIISNSYQHVEPGENEPIGDDIAETQQSEPIEDVGINYGEEQ